MERGSTVQGHERFVPPEVAGFRPPQCDCRKGFTKRFISIRAVRFAFPVPVGQNARFVTAQHTQRGDSARPAVASLALGHSPPTTQERTAAARSRSPELWLARRLLNRMRSSMNGTNGPHGKNCGCLSVSLPNRYWARLAQKSGFPTCVMTTERDNWRHFFRFGVAALWTTVAQRCVTSLHNRKRGRAIPLATLAATPPTPTRGLGGD